MLRHEQNALARERLDARFSDRMVIDRLARPPRGWIRAIRQALGMTTGQLAHRLGLGQSSVVDLEKSEAMGTIRLSSLKKAAEALNCTLVYALVPNEPLEEMVRGRKEAIANRAFYMVDQTMRLEDQAVEDSEVKRRHIVAMIDQIDEKTLWREGE